MIGLGLAIAQPDKPVLVITGDGEALMGLGALASVAAQKPDNLTSLFWTTPILARPACSRAIPAMVLI